MRNFVFEEISLRFSQPKIGKRWVFDPDSGGKKIPETVKRDVTQRIEKYAAEHYAGKYTRLDIRFRAQFCYIDAYRLYFYVAHQ